MTLRRAQRCVHVVKTALKHTHRPIKLIQMLQKLTESPEEHKHTYKTWHIWLVKCACDIFDLIHTFICDWGGQILFAAAVWVQKDTSKWLLLLLHKLHAICSMNSSFTHAINYEIIHVWWEYGGRTIHLFITDGLSNSMKLNCYRQQWIGIITDKWFFKTFFQN